LNDVKEERKKRILELSLKYNILSPYTAFIGIEKRINGNHDDMVLREVPIQISVDDQHLQTPHISNTYMRAIPLTLEVRSFHKLLGSKSGCSNSLDLWDSGGESTALAVMPKHRVGWNLFRLSAQRKRAATPTKSRTLEFIRKTIGSLSTSQPTLSREKYAFDHRRCSFNTATNENKDIFPTDDQNIVRYLIHKQQFDGLWDLNSKNIQQLTGKALSHFQQSINTQVLITAIVVLVLETRFASFSSMWHGVVEKARKRLLNLLENDDIKLNTLFTDIRKQF
jgi:hypothetical protein